MYDLFVTLSLKNLGVSYTENEMKKDPHHKLYATGKMEISNIKRKTLGNSYALVYVQII